MINSDFGILLQIVGFLFAFGTFRVWFYMFYEFIRREIVYQISYKRIRKTEEFKKLKTLKERWTFNRNFTKLFKEEYNKTHLSKLMDKGEEQWPALKNILNFVGWVLITIGLIYQFSFVQNRSFPFI